MKYLAIAATLTACAVEPPTHTSAAAAIAADDPGDDGSDSGDEAAPFLLYTCTTSWDYAGNVPQRHETASHLFDDTIPGLYEFIAWRDTFVDGCEAACACHCALHCTAAIASPTRD